MSVIDQNEALLRAGQQASQMTEAAKKIELHNAGEQLASIARSVPAKLVAGGQAMRELPGRKVLLTHAQAIAGLEAAEDALRFIENMKIMAKDEDTGEEKVLAGEPLSQWEARAGLAKVLKAIDEA